MWRNSKEHWGTVAIALHWTMALLVLVQVVLGIVADSWRVSPLKLDLFVWHKSVGMLLLALVVIRLAWRLANPSPMLPEGTPRWQRIAARASHAALYAVLVALPLAGWVINSAANIPFRIFWLIPLPDITAPDKALQSAAESVHFVLFVTLAGLVLVHAAAALWHHYRLGDDVLVRMLRPHGSTWGSR